MCGIAGILSSKKLNEDQVSQLSSDMLKSLAARGPDGEGLFNDQNNNITFIHRRLAILDLSDNGSQPQQSPSGRYTIVYNGEIYNHLELRKAYSLDLPGNSDTQTLLALIEKIGVIPAIHEINGMYAFAVWDAKNREVFFCRDRMGEKPLYFGFIGDDFLFSSDLSALKCHPNFTFRINTFALQQYFECGFIPSPNSIYEGIYKLPPASYMILSLDQLTEQRLSGPYRYWEIPICSAQPKASIQEYEEALSKKISEAVKRQLLSDVPVGVLLSGGLDSSLIVSYVAEHCPAEEINTFTVSFPETDFDEAPRAKKTANFFNTKHYEITCSAADILFAAKALPEIFSEPFADSSQIPTFLLAKNIKGRTKVVLSGDGGDEIFAGYNRHKWTLVIQLLNFSLFKIPKKMLSYFMSSIGGEWFKNVLSSKLNSTEFEKKWRQIRLTLNAANANCLYAQYLSFGMRGSKYLNFPPRKLRTSLPDHINKRGLSLLDKIMIRDAMFYLPDNVLTKVDRAFMHASIEARAPFLDAELQELCWRIPTNKKINLFRDKIILRSLFEKKVRGQIKGTKKRGFTPPLAQWLRGPLQSWAEALIEKNNSEQTYFINWQLLVADWKQFRQGDDSKLYDIWKFLVFIQWFNHELEQNQHLTIGAFDATNT